MKEFSDIGDPHPRSKAGLFSVLFFTYTLDTFRKGCFWNVSNLYKPLDCHRSDVLGEKFERIWMHHAIESKKNDKKPNICTVLFRLFWLDILIDSIILILSLIPRIIQPLLLGNLLSYFSSKTEITKYEAYWYISLLIFFNLMSTIISVHYKYSSSITAMKIRIACSTGVFKKTLRMNQGAPNNALNLISNDLSRFDRTSNYVHYIWGSPLFLISILNVIYFDVGISGLAGVIWFILYMFFQSFFARWIGSYRNLIAKKTDIRIKLMNEILSSIKVIKMYSWENSFEKLVKDARQVEMKIVKKVTYFKGILYSLQAFVNVFAIFLSLVSMVILKEEITAPKVFKLIMYYYSFNYVITLMFPLSVTKATELHQILKRVNEFLTQEEIQNSRSCNSGNAKERLVVQDLIVMWPSHKRKSSDCHKIITSDAELLLKGQEQKYLLHNINVKMNDGMLYGITGAVGSGKSSLLLSILGETKISGNLYLNGSVSYASQEPWFISGTIRQNILFGQPFEEKRYSEVIRVCGLKTDLDMLPKHDETPVRECGFCLSGGQKSRINMARAVYKEVDIYLFDDPLSSVDGNVGDFVMDQCLLGFLKNKCCLLVTHNVKQLRKCDKILIMNSGRLDKQDTFEQLEDDGWIFHDNSVGCISNEKGHKKGIEENSFTKTNEKQRNDIPQSRKEKKWEVIEYLTSGNHILVITFVILALIITQTSESYIFLFISYWTHSEEIKNFTSNVTYGERDTRISGRYFHLLILVGILGALLSSSIIRAVSYSIMVMRSSKTLHNKMLHSVMHSKLAIFETIDIGQILTRFSKDLAAVDEILPRTILESCIVVIGIAARILLIGYVNPYLVLVVLAFGALFSRFIRIFVNTSKNLKRIEGKLMGPLLSQVKSTIEGLPTIRAMKAQDNMEKEYFGHQDRYTSSCYMFSTITHAFSFGVEFITTIFISIVTVSCFFMEESIRLNGSKIGLAITQAMAFTTYLQFCIIQCVQANNHLVAVERIQEYDDLPQETVSINSEEFEADCSTLGKINFNNVQAQYMGNLEPALKDLSFNIRTGEKVAIVGRTGGGKSSIIAAILKLIDVKGEILIDSKDIRDIPTNILRSRISVLPQDPVIFPGTLRFNLDPFGKIDDNILYKALRDVGLCSSSFCNNLDDQIDEKGLNMSLGQKQLICLARILVRKNKIILIDEATSNLDIETDMMIQQVIRRQFKDCTILTIAHRLSTVLDYDRIMVIDYGRLVEFDSPEVLLEDNTSKLYEIMYGKK